ncbi:MAG: DoxX family membrane protein [Thermonemataceae bacterium]
MKNNVKRIVLWALRLTAAAIMLQTLYYKFSAHPQSVELFTTLHMEPWGRVGVGILELTASMLLFIPSKNWLGASLAIGLMLGAIFFHLTILGTAGSNGLLFGLAIITLVSSSLLLYLQRNQVPFHFLQRKVNVF